MRKATANGDGTLPSKTKPVNQKNASAPPPSAKRQKPGSSPTKEAPRSLEERIMLLLYGTGLAGRAKHIHEAMPRGTKLPEVLSVLERLGAAGLIVRINASADPGDTTWRAAQAKPAPPVEMERPKIPDHLQMAVIRLADLYEEAMDIPLDPATALLHGMRDLIAYHPELRNYHKALDEIVEGENFLNRSCGSIRRAPSKSRSSNRDAATTALCHAYGLAMSTKYESAISDLKGVRDLIAHNHKLREYQQAITRMANGHRVLLEMCEQVRAL